MWDMCEYGSGECGICECWKGECGIGECRIDECGMCAKCYKASVYKVIWYNNKTAKWYRICPMGLQISKIHSYKSDLCNYLYIYIWYKSTVNEICVITYIYIYDIRAQSMRFV